MSDRPNEDEVVERVYDALESGRAEDALALAREALARDSEDAVVRFLAGLACLELDRDGEAVTELRAAVRIDPEDAEFRSQFAYALFRACRFDEAREHASKALELDEASPDAHYTAALLAERGGDDAGADSLFARARDLDADSFPLPVRLDDAEFDAVLAEAREFLEERFRRCLDDVIVTVEPLPSEAVLTESQPPMDPELLGLFVGVPLNERSSFSPGGDLPPRILLFKRNLERIFPEREALREEIARTLHHELGHYLGLDEDELDAIDLG
jgi:predicted Zn-dependent protease with MMP-like domain